MFFDIKGKIALISGGASGIGLRYAKELLRNGLRVR
jgi:NAD(P)-dependent dehydrogenase (short-subunit alcohol dehydrogenase family)